MSLVSLTVTSLSVEVLLAIFSPRITLVVDPATVYNVINYVTIASTGNAIDFGDLTFAIHTNGASNYFAGTSDVHGGLG